MSYYLSTENPADKKRKRKDVFDDISLKNKPEKELACKIRIRIKFSTYTNACYHYLLKYIIIRVP